MATLSGLRTFDRASQKTEAAFCVGVPIAEVPQRPVCGVRLTTRPGYSSVFLLWPETIQVPGAVTLLDVPKSVVQTRWSALPKFDLVGDHAKPTPMRGARNIAPR
jgi:hypothetical protein